MDIRGNEGGFGRFIVTDELLALSYQGYLIGYFDGAFEPADNDDLYVNAAALKEMAA
jgi:hypothetical protein